jgi:hypothetical protein
VEARTVLPVPAGALTRVSGPRTPRSSSSSRRGLRTNPGGGFGTTGEPRAGSFNRLSRAFSVDQADDTDISLADREAELLNA